MFYPLTPLRCLARAVELYGHKLGVYLLLTLLVPIATEGQIKKEGLKDLYVQLAPDMFLAQPEIVLKAVYNQDNVACGVMIFGARSDQEIMKIVYEVVPVDSRGLKVQEWLDCTGACEKIVEFDNFLLISGLVANQKSTPSAFLRFTTTGCAETFVETGKWSLFIERRE